ncbi:MAG: hypothetical protein KDA25_02035, partial [Phycisphaerales bacterium]|nr:hypothetical protein [Phycisphaerales bacterium]
MLCLLFVVSPVMGQEEEEDQDATAAAAIEAADPSGDDTGDESGDETGDDDKADEVADEDKPRLTGGLIGGLRFRSLGPALMSGRIGDFAVNPARPSEYYVAVCSGGVWKTTNGGTTFTPVFDGEGSYSIGCVTLDPNDSNTVWVGTGENNSQRSVSWGDGVYVSHDGGRSWKNVGLKASEHIGMIAVDPRDSNTVYVAAQGPLWRSGGDRGLYKTVDGGATWNRILHISDDTGANEVHLDPRDPDVVYVSTYQRRRHVWTLIDGGPESAIHRSRDGGATWTKLTRGLPGGDRGRIGMDLSPVNPDVIYAIVEASGDSGGFYRSTNRGETWERRNGIMSSSPMYYNEIVCDPKNVDRVYLLETFLRVTEDGGATWGRAPRRDRHVDDHALWIDPDDTDHLLMGCDGGIYETWDRGEAWDFKPNLPVTQFYRVAVDESWPHTFIYGGTQDNNTLGGPTRTTSSAGIANEDWFVTVGGDGFEPQVDPTDPNIVYSQWQHGGLVRFDRRSGERVDIRPQEAPGDPTNRWNWDSPLLISPHDPARLYFGSQRLYRSDDRGNAWTPISGDLTRQLDRNALEVMGRIQKADAVAKHQSTSLYGNLVALSESPLVEGLLYVGTDDGLIQVSEDGGTTWRRIDAFAGIPELAYVSCVQASMHDTDTVYATFDHHKMGDFTPYVLRSTDRGQTWTSIAGDLPERHVAWAIREDHVRSDLLFLGTEFGLFITLDGGEHWLRHKGGLPTIAVRDLEIQRRDNDLVLATFGRGFYILDDYAPLRDFTEDNLRAPATVYPVRDALLYVESSRLGGRSGRGSQGASYYNADNPPFGAVITYHIGETFKTRRDLRREAEKKDDAPYPTIDDLRAEGTEAHPMVVLTIRDPAQRIVRRLEGSRSRGLHRATWDLRERAVNPIESGPGEGAAPWRASGAGPFVVPGAYSVTVSSVIDGVETDLTEPVWFNVAGLDLATFAAADRQAVLDFNRQAASLASAVRATSSALAGAETRARTLRQAIYDSPDVDPALRVTVQTLLDRINTIQLELDGDSVAAARAEEVPPSIRSRSGDLSGGLSGVTSAPTQTQRDLYRWVGDALERVIADVRAIIDDEIPAIEAHLDDAGAPWTPGRLPTWRPGDDRR